jgi:hypothetical protein
MATRKELLDSLNFARRRMVSNVLQPSPYGSDQAAPKPLRNFGGSIALAVVIMLVCLIVGFRGSSSSSGWQSGKGLVVVDSGAGGEYLVTPAPNLRAYPFVNPASAELYFGAGFTTYQVSSSQFASLKNTLGPAIGIPNLPNKLPSASNLTLHAWSLCSQPIPLDQHEVAFSNGTATAADVQTVLEIGTQPEPAAPAALTADQGLVVHTPGTADNPVGDVYFIWNGTAFHVRRGDVDRVMDALANPVARGVQVGQLAKPNWIAALPQGPEIYLPSLPASEVGKVLSDPHAPSVMNRIGMYGVYTTGGISTYYIVTPEGVASVSSFMYHLYQQSTTISRLPAAYNQQVTLTPQAEGVISGFAITNPASLGGAEAGAWPGPQFSIANNPTDTSQQTLCAYFNGQFDGQNPHLTMTAEAKLPVPLTTDEGTSTNGDVGTGLADVVFVTPGSGAIARNAGSSISTVTSAVGDRYLIADTGMRYLLANDSDTPQNSSSGGNSQNPDAIRQLGYIGVSQISVPNSWLMLLPAGPNLDPAAARNAAVSQ